MEKSVEDVLLQIQAGDSMAREQLILQFRPFVIRTVSHICKRQIGWNDDESSIGLIALNEAIDRFEPNHGKSFQNFAYMIIHNRLTDEFRKKGKLSQKESLVLDANDEYEAVSGEIAASLTAYEQREAQAELAQELLRYDETLQQYGIKLEELEDCSPDHRDARIRLIQIAKQCGQRPEWLAHLYEKKQLPVKEMLKTVQVSRKTIERNRKYLIALILIYTCDEFGKIRSNVSFADIGE
ncbi:MULTISPECIES: RNA polymerase sigma-I factor [unclassified Paenibacillus]|uniref:RNA polymerase sigma-I factor n=1 Tax=unclassified Paenibacillus TaxID=185978 RepID=UPI001C124AFF|nr:MULTISPECIES: RNA polymerase sigma-I factor [unclassified Paenibacillus]MBU5442040.1 RNA polymerase sigma-I factor [Paenibacillus sp. MSJ-34]CAH0120472.1 RNA polymerase sigma factor SigI [Paenibacillus sp. CECT 9249]